MIVGIKDTARLAAIAVMAFCAVFVCTMFLNYNMDIGAVSSEITSPQAKTLYSAMLSVSKMVCSLSGGCLAITSAVMLLFYVRHYVNLRKKELGILKALGYTDLQASMSFGIFGISVLAGAAAGFCGAYAVMPLFYKAQNKDGLLPDIGIGFHPSLLLYSVLLPGAFFATLSVFSASRMLKKPVISLLKDTLRTNGKIKERRDGSAPELSFTAELRKSNLKTKKALVFFMIFSSFCFSAMTQMSFSMNELSSFLMGAIIMLIGVTLACTTLILASSATVGGNTKTIAMMKAFGYSEKECRTALLDGYRPWSYAGFALGTGYQYLLLKIAVNILFKDVENVPDYKFNLAAAIVSLAAFAVLYELVIYMCAKRIEKVSVKEIMLE